MTREESNTLRLSGFTLVELVAVLAIIAVLATLLLPVMSRTKTSARLVVCKNNVKQLGLALNLYLTDFEQYPLDLRNGDLSYGYWRNLLAPYCGSSAASKLFVCPLIPSRSRQLTGNSYEYNAWGTERYMNEEGPSWGRWPDTTTLGLGAFGALTSSIPVAASRVAVPSDMIAIGDGIAFFEMDYGRSIAGFGWPGKYFGVWSGWPHGVGDRVLGSFAALCDGHVETSNPDHDPTKEAYNVLADGYTYWRFKPDQAHARRWNNDNQPHPETWPKD
jgi:prepilin-type N-terminal cleavage/methylation domain-containing protein